MMIYKDCLTSAMEMLAEHPKTMVVGYNTTCGGTASCFPPERRPELPLAEALNTGIATGLSLMGYIPIAWYERMDFVLHALDQIVNHADKLDSLSGIHKPAIIYRVAVGNKHTPLLTGPTHCQDFSLEIANMVTFPVIRLRWSDSILHEYKTALARALNGQSTMLVEYRDLYNQP